MNINLNFEWKNGKLNKNIGDWTKIWKIGHEYEKLKINMKILNINYKKLNIKYENIEYNYEKLNIKVLNINIKILNFATYGQP